MIENREYKMSLDDKIDWKIIDQLHSATLNFSSLSLELKKLFFILIGIAVPTLIKLAGDKLDLSLFVSIYLFSITFWALDSLTYFYQEKLRENMDKRFSELKARNAEVLILTDKKIDDYTLEDTRTSKDRIKRSITNLSVKIYIFALILNTFAFTLYLLDVIK